MYDPTIGQFLNEDPLGFLGGDTNLRRYVGNDTPNTVDPTGLFPDDIVGPLGSGDDGFVPLDQPMDYEIDFENEPTGGLPPPAEDDFPAPAEGQNGTNDGAPSDLPWQAPPWPNWDPPAIA